MPVAAYPGPNSHVGNGVTTVFAYSFRILDESDLIVTVDGVLQTLTTHYTVAGEGDSGGGSIAFLSAPANLAAIIIQRVRPYVRTTDYQRNGSFDEETVDRDHDSQEMQIQQLAAAVARAFKPPVEVTADQVLTSALWAARHGKLMGFDASSGGFTLLAAADVDLSVVSAFIATLLDDANAGAARSTLGLGALAMLDTVGTAQLDDGAVTPAKIAAGYGLVPSGTILDFGGTSTPTGYLGCDGSNVSRTTYAGLFAAIGTAWGAGDGSTTFTLPDFRRRVAMGSGGSAVSGPANTVGSVGGAETHTLIEAEMPAHTHTPLGGNSFITSVGAGSIAPAGANFAAVATTSSTGGGGAHTNVQPSAVVLKIIKT